MERRVKRRGVLMTAEVQKTLGEVAGLFMTRLVKQILRMRECLKNEADACEWWQLQRNKGDEPNNEDVKKSSGS